MTGEATIISPIRTPTSSSLVYLSGLATPTHLDPLLWWSQAKKINNISRFHLTRADVKYQDITQTLPVCVASEAFFKAMGATPHRGRLPSYSVRDNAKAPLAVLSYDLWKKLGSTDAIFTTPLTVSGYSVDIIAVLPAAFKFPPQVQVWLIYDQDQWARSLPWNYTTTESPLLNRPDNWIGTLTEHATPRIAQQELLQLNAQLHETYTKRTGLLYGNILNVVLLNKILFSEYLPIFRILLFATIFLYIGSLANASILLLGLTASRQREFALRRSLGAGRQAIGLQIIVETAFLVALIFFTAIFLALIYISASEAFFNTIFPTKAMDLHISPSLLTYLSICLFAAIAIPGVAQYLVLDESQLSGRSLYVNMGSGRRVIVFSRTLLVSAVALCFVLLIAGIMCEKSIRRIAKIDPYLNPKTLSVELIHQPPGGRSIGSAEVEVLLEDLNNLPMIRASALTTFQPLVSEQPAYVSASVGQERYMVLYAAVTRNYFDTVGLKFIAGSGFGTSAERSVVVNEEFVRVADESRLQVGSVISLEGEKGIRHVAGVVKTGPAVYPTDLPTPQIFLPYEAPYREASLGTRPFALVLDPRNEIKVGYQELRPLIAAAVSDASILSMQSVEESLNSKVSFYRESALLVSFYSLLSLLIVVCGIYAIVSYTISQRRLEIAMRQVVGASGLEICIQLLLEAIVPLVVGTCIGASVALACSNIISKITWGVDATDQTVYLLSFGIMAVIGVGFSLIAVVPVIRQPVAELLKSSSS